MDDFFEDLNKLGGELEHGDVKYTTRYKDAVREVEAARKEREQLEDEDGETRKDGGEAEPNISSVQELKDAVDSRAVDNVKRVNFGVSYVSIKRVISMFEYTTSQGKGAADVIVQKRRVKFVQSRQYLQKKQLKRIEQLMEENDQKLRELIVEARESYRVDLNSSDERDNLPEEVKSRIYGMFVNRTDLHQQLRRIRFNLLRDLNDSDAILKSFQPEAASFRLMWRAVVGDERASAEVDQLRKKKINLLEKSTPQRESLVKQLDAIKAEYNKALDKAYLEGPDFQRPVIGQGKVDWHNYKEDREAKIAINRDEPEIINLLRKQEELRKAEEQVREAREEIEWLEKEFERVQEVEEEAPSLIDDLFDGTEEEDNKDGILFQLRRLDKMVGITAAKGQIATDLVSLMVNPQRFGDEHFNIALLGHPGTGKTALADIVAPLYKLAGIIPNAQSTRTGWENVSPNDLQSSFQAATAVRTAGLIMRYALGGVLFIDEAYGLGLSGKGGAAQEGGGSGAEAITQLVKSLDEFKGLVLVIVAGYEKKMNRYFFGMNPGLTSRFPRRIFLHDYTAEELHAIFTRQRVALGFSISKAADMKVKATLYEMKKYDDYEASLTMEERTNRIEIVKRLREEVRSSSGRGAATPNIFGGGSGRLSSDEECSKLENQSRLLDIEQKVQELSQLSIQDDQFDPPGFFRESNARGVGQFLRECVDSHAIRSLRNMLIEEDVGAIDEFGKILLADDVRSAAYSYSRQALGVEVNYVHTQTRRPGSLKVIDDAYASLLRGEDKQLVDDSDLIDTDDETDDEDYDDDTEEEVQRPQRSRRRLSRAREPAPQHQLFAASFHANLAKLFSAH